jgi:5-methylcytosine-specific restriction protein A
MPRSSPVFRPPGVRTRAQADVARGTRHERGYTTAWVKASKLFLLEHPTCACADCAARAIPLRSTVVDHIVPHRGNGQLFWDPTNWQALNKHCHDRKTWHETHGAPVLAVPRPTRRY